MYMVAGMGGGGAGGWFSRGCMILFGLQHRNALQKVVDTKWRTAVYN